MRVAIPRFGESVAPCFEYSATMAIFTIEDGRIAGQIDVAIESRVAYDRVRLMKAKRVDTVICGGVQAFYEDLLKADDIQVISWVSGKVDDLLNLFIEGRLTAGEARLGGHEEAGGTKPPAPCPVANPLENT